MSDAKSKICNAMMSLLQEKEFEKITVSDIVKMAEINRSSYYYHFYDKKEIVDLIIDDICTEIVTPPNECLDVINIDRNYVNAQRQREIICYYNHFQEIRTLYHAGFKSLFEEKMYNAFFRERFKYENVFINNATQKTQTLSNGVLYNIKTIEDIYCTMADLDLIVRYDFEIPFEQFLELSSQAKDLRFISGTMKRLPKNNRDYITGF